MKKKSSIDELFEAASAARDNAYAPFSGFKVGSAVRAGSGKIYSGCNVENASFGATICAERNAIGQAISAGEREIVEVMVVTDTPAPTAPCGVCRQIIYEFGPTASVHMARSSDRPGLKSMKIAKLLPLAFRFEKKHQGR